MLSLKRHVNNRTPGLAVTTLGCSYHGVRRKYLIFWAWIGLIQPCVTPTYDSKDGLLIEAGVINVVIYMCISAIKRRLVQV